MGKEDESWSISQRQTLKFSLNPIPLSKDQQRTAYRALFIPKPISRLRDTLLIVRQAAGSSA